MFQNFLTKIERVWVITHLNRGKFESNWRGPKTDIHLVLPNLYIYKIVAILFLGNQTPPTVLVTEGWNLGTNPAIVGGRPLTNFFEIGPRVPRLGPNFGQNLNKIAITREPLGRFGWNLDWRDIFKLYYHLNSMVKALKSTGIEIMVAQNT